MVDSKTKFKIFKRAERVVTSGLDFDVIIEQLVDLLVEVTEAANCSLFLGDGQGNLLIRAKRGEVDENLKRKFAEWTFKTGIYIFSNNPNEEQKFKDWLNNEKNIIVFPISQKERIVGVVEVSNKEGGFVDEDLEMVEIFASDIATAFENYQLYSQMQDKIRRLEALIETSLHFSQILDLQRLLDIIMRRAEEVMEAEASSIFQVDEKNRELYFVLATGTKAEEVKKVRVPFGKGVVGWVYEQGEPLLVPDTTKDPRWYGGVDRESKFVTKSILAVPLKVKDRTIGVAEVLNKKGGKSFTREDLELFDAMGRQIAIALENANLYRELDELFLSSIRSIVAAIDAKDPYTEGHSKRVVEYSMMIAKGMNMRLEEQKEVELSSILHDVGKIGIPDRILGKKALLSKKERSYIEKHPIMGAEIIKPIEKLKELVPNILHHHERYDGHGYPLGLKGLEIPLVARIICVADSFDAMTSDRPYRKALPTDKALAEIRDLAGQQFDPDASAAFLREYAKVL